MLLLASLPFAALLLSIAIFPLLPHKHAHWWDQNRNKLIISLILSAVVTTYYGIRETGVSFPEEDEPVAVHHGLAAVGTIIKHAVFEDYVPFIILLFSLYTVAGGIRIIEDIPAHAFTNTCILALGAVLANLIGTTGASMLLIRPLLQINSERTRKSHTVIFFIIIVSNIGGCLSPIGPPLFLGYLFGVPFSWPLLHLWPMWLIAVAALLAVYFSWDHFYCYPHEPKTAIVADETTLVPLEIHGKHNLLLLLLIVFIVATTVRSCLWMMLGRS